MTKDGEPRPAGVLVHTSKDGITWVAGIDPDWTYLWVQSAESMVAEHDARAAGANEVPLSERGFGV